jgi:hypothetical protein
VTNTPRRREQHDWRQPQQGVRDVTLERHLPRHAAIAARLRRPADRVAGQDVQQEGAVEQHHDRRDQEGHAALN